MNKKISLGAALALLLIVAALVFSITMNYATNNFNQMVSDLKSRETISKKYAELDNLVRQNYNGEINDTQLMNRIAEGYLAGIDDKFSRYITAEEYKKLLADTESENVGIGAVIEVSPDDFYLVVKEVYPDSPAEVAGIQAGDLIVKIDDTTLSRDNSAQMFAAISGPQGSNLSIVTRREGVESTPIQLTRRAVAIPTVLHTRILEDSTVGYMHISEFRERTYDQFNRELLHLTDSGATSLIIDLRDNNSDYLDSMTRILDKLLPEGVLVSASYKDGSTQVIKTSDNNDVNLPIVVLTNAGTTGMGELFAQNIRDFGKGRTVGVTTAGKGVMQNILKLSDGSAIELAVAYYLTNSGQNIHKVGVKPDFDVAFDGNWQDYLEIESNDPQLVKAKEVALSLEKTAGNASASAEQGPAASEWEQSASSSQPEFQSESAAASGEETEESDEGDSDRAVGDSSGDEDDSSSDTDSSDDEEASSSDTDSSDDE